MVFRFRITLAMVALLTWGTSTLMAEPIGWMEKFALAADRGQVLDQLIPGSEDYYFYHCLHYQTTGELDRAEAMIREWLGEHKGRQTPLIQSMLDRQRLLTYQESPQRTIDYLVKRLGVKLQHAPPMVQGERRFPSRLDEATLAVDRLVKEALQRNDALKPVGMAHLAKLFLEDNTAGVSINLHEFLKRVDGPYLPELDKLVIKELAGRKENDKRFGDLPAHNFLTLAQLNRVGQTVPRVADDNAFVDAKLARLRPDGDSDPNQQPEVRRDYLQRVVAYTQTLPASYNSLKASAVYRLLEAKLASGEYDRDLFLRYLQLPRTSPIVHPEWSRRALPKAKLSDDFTKTALLPPIGDEQTLVRAYLDHFLKDDADTDAFSDYLQPEYLRRVFAESKLLHGVGDPEQWYKMLSASQRQALRDSVMLRFAPQNKPRFGAEEATRLLVDVKNIDELVVRIYKINTLSYYRTHEALIDTDIDLDGLIATHERRLSFKTPAVQRHREELELDEISGRGVWIVDLVGKSSRARALVQRGEIEHVDSTVADGMAFTIVDETRQPIPAAKMWVGAREFIADADGRIVLPPVADHSRRRAIITDGKIARPIRFDHLREQYQLDAGMCLDRTQLQTGAEATLLIRPRLKMAGHPIDPASLTEVTVLVVARDLEGHTTTVQFDDQSLDQQSELVLPLRVTPRLANLSVTLSAKISGLADGQNRTLQTSHAWDVAGIRRTHHTHDTFLTRDGDDYVIEVRGRSGERIAGATVSVSLGTSIRSAPVEQTLQSDDNGNVQLSPLAGVTHIRFGVPGGMQHDQPLQLDRVVWPGEIHTTSDRPIHLPVTSTEDAAEMYRLMELRGGSFHRDQTDHLSLESGRLTIRPLSPGDFQLIDRTTNRATQIVVVDGPQFDSVAAGRTRHRSIAPGVALGIADIQRGEEGLKVKLSGDAQFARVHVYASRYLDSSDPMSQLRLPLPGLFGRGVYLPRCGYVSDVKLGDEYQYVLRRRYAQKYPGVMLPQPSVLLNPWETEETTNSQQTAEEGEDLERSMPGAGEAADSARPERRVRQSGAPSSDFDFLADAGTVMANLRADDDGVVTIPADVIDGLPLVQIVVCDPVTVLQRIVTAPLEDAETVDLRLAEALDVDKPLSLERAVAVVNRDEPLDLKSLGSAQVQVYGSVGALFKLYKTMIGDSRLAEFDELASWHKLTDARKSDAYSRLASHELHLFIWAHDRKYFDQVIRPYLSNKKEKQFLDQWLLEEDLSPYTELWQYNQLNAAERALLAMRLPEVREMIRRELAEIVAEQDEDHQAARALIENALLFGKLSTDATDNDFGIVAGAKVAGGDQDGLAELEAVTGMLGANLARGGETDKRGAATRWSKQQAQAKRRGLSVAPLYSKRARKSDREFSFFRELDSTKQWAESQWDRIRTVGSTPAALIQADPFWADLAGADAASPAVSVHLLRPIGNRHSALVALAMCGLPLEAGDIRLPTEPDQRYAPEHAVALVTKRLRLLEAAEQESSILVGQQFAAVNADKKDPEEPTEFLTGVAYQGQTVLSNPTSREQIVEVFWQIPAGSLPLGGSQMTDSRTVTLKPFAVQAIQYQFYFPLEGKFIHYPATVAAGGKLISRGTKKNFSVVRQPSEDDRMTWPKVARTGSPKEIRAFLAVANLRELDWMLIAHRMKDQQVYREIIKVLAETRLPIKELWAYSLHHRDEPAMKSFLAVRDDLVSGVGPVLKSPLLEVEPIARRTHEMLEYAPLVRARIHRLGEDDEILNPTFLAQYRSFVRVLGFSDQVPNDEKLALTYYLLIQNRIEEAMDVFTKMDGQSIRTQLQYDYVDAYLAMHREQFDRAEKIAAAHAQHPIPRWQRRFAELALQLKQRRGLQQNEQLVSTEEKDSEPPIAQGSGDLAVLDRERRQADASDAQPEVIVRVEGDSLKIDHRRADEVTLNLYGVDLELLFSKAPFVREDLQRMAMVEPQRRESIEFDDATGIGSFELDENLRRQTLLVEAIAGASRSTALYYGGEITTYVSESYGQLQTTDASTHRPLSTAYVKVYARYPDGSVRFYKDGYTDARGRFDYATISANDARGAQRFAILVLSDEKGATLHDVPAPSQ